MADDRASHKEKDSDVIVIHADTQNVYDDDTLDPVYAAKAKILNDSLQEIGMGKYQVCPNARCKVSTYAVVKWYLFVVAGFGWLSCVSPIFEHTHTHPNGT